VTLRILGISAFYHDSAAALIVDGDIVAAAQEERFTRIKHDSSFPQNAVRACLDIGGITLDDVDYIAFYDKPFLKFERLLVTYLSFAPHGFGSFQKALPVWLKEKLFLKDLLVKKLKKAGAGEKIGERLLFAEHHFSHAASAFFPSPFEEAVVLTVDGVGEWATTTGAIGRGNKLSIEKQLHFPHSLGLLYSAFTYYTGFKVNSGEYKVMGLAPYGEPKFKDIILDRIVDLKEDGTFHLDQSYFDYCTGLRMTNEKFAALFGQPPRKPETELLTQFHMDVAASIQAVTEEVMLRLTRSLAREYGIPNLCLAGGVALNCVANGKIVRDQSFRNVWIQPAAGDAGGAVGAALATWHTEFDKPRNDYRDHMRGALLGPSFSDEEIPQRLNAVGARFDTLSREPLLKRTAEALSVGKAVGWFQGRMEFGPRALGARSIIADPQSPTMQKNLNLKVKFRESFRPFAPAVLREDVAQWFQLDTDSPYMLLVANVSEDHRRAMTNAEQLLFGIDKLNVVRSDIPAVTHVNYSARVQTVDRETNELFYDLLAAFKKRTGCGVLVNTSFNVRGEPIVCTPEDGFRCFVGTELDVFVCGNTYMERTLQDPTLREDYKTKYELD
jgi:carbamoyltransferase